MLFYEITPQNYLSEQIVQDVDWIKLAALVHSVSILCCSSFRDYLMCSQRIVMEKCGEQTAKFTEDFLNQMSFSLIQVWLRALPPKKFLAFYGSWRCITVLTKSSHLSLSWARLIQSPPSHSHSLRPILNIILPSTPRSSQQPPVWAASSCVPHVPPISSPDNIRWAVQIVMLLITQFSPVPLSLICLRQHPTLKHPQHMFLPQCDRHAFSHPCHATRNRPRASYVCCNLYVVRCR